MKKQLIISIILLTALVMAGCVTPPYCGNDICESNENHDNCPEDCPAPFTPLIHVTPVPITVAVTNHVKITVSEPLSGAVVAGETMTLQERESFTVNGKNDYEGMVLTVTLTRIFDGGTEYQATFQLTNAIGEVIDTQTVGYDDMLIFIDGSTEVVAEDIYIEEIKFYA